MNKDYGWPPFKSTETELKQMTDFLEDIKRISDNLPEAEYLEDIIQLRDETCLLRSKYSIVYAKLLEKSR